MRQSWPRFAMPADQWSLSTRYSKLRLPLIKANGDILLLLSIRFSEFVLTLPVEG
jgi:hypothetical protein